MREVCSTCGYGVGLAMFCVCGVVSCPRYDFRVSAYVRACLCREIVFVLKRLLYSGLGSPFLLGSWTFSFMWMIQLIESW